jgi:hypothetical protein
MVITDLLRAAADALDEGRDPLENGFLQDNEATADQVLDLRELLAIGARIAAVGVAYPRSVEGQSLAKHMKDLT